MVKMKLADYCAATGKARRTVSRMCSSGMVHAVKEGGSWVVGLDLVQKAEDDDCYDCNNYFECDTNPGCGGKCAEVDVFVEEDDEPEAKQAEVIEVNVPVKIPVKLLLQVAGIKVG